jgi:hypothetical protein
MLPPNLSLGLNVGLQLAQFTYRQTTLQPTRKPKLNRKFCFHVTGIAVTHTKTPHSHRLLYGVMKEKKKNNFNLGMVPFCRVENYNTIWIACG